MWKNGEYNKDKEDIQLDLVLRFSMVLNIVKSIYKKFYMDYHTPIVTLIVIKQTAIFVKRL